MIIKDVDESIQKWIDLKFNLIPLGNEKDKPKVKWKKFQTEKNTKEELHKWFNIGKYYPAIICGAISNGVIVLDCDDPKIPELLDIDTLTVETPSGGIHLYVKANIIPPKIEHYNGFALDIQGEKSYAVLPPFPGYKVIKDRPIKTIDNVMEFLKEKIPTNVSRTADIKNIKKELSKKITCSEYIKKFVTPIKTGHGYWNGLCPFHDEDNGSFTVYKDDYYCYGCGKSGDIISFVMEKDNLNFKDAVEFLTLEYDIKVSLQNDENLYIETANKIMNQVIIKTLTDNQLMLMYLNGYYQSTDVKNIINGFILDILDDKYTTHRVNEILNYIQLRTYINRDRFDTNPDILCLRNGLLDIHTKELMNWTPEHLFMNQFNLIYDAEAQCPHIEQFFSDIMHPEDIPAIEEFFGYCLLKSYPLHKAFMLLGEGFNGKSTLIRLLVRFLGKENVSHIDIQSLVHNRFAPANLYGKMANMYADLPSDALQKTDKFKALTGEDNLHVEEKFKQGFNFLNYAKMIFSTNKLPEVMGDDTDAFYNRWHLINFPNQFLGNNAIKDIDVILHEESEMSGLLNLALIGLERLMKNGQFSNSKTVDEIRDQYNKMSDSMCAFIDNRLECDSESRISRQELYDTYIVYCGEHQLPFKSKKVFNKRLQELIPVETIYPLIDDKQVRCFSGIKFKELTYEDMEYLKK